MNSWRRIHDESSAKLKGNPLISLRKRQSLEKKKEKPFYRMNYLGIFTWYALQLLSEIALWVLTASHSNVAEKRVLSIIRKNKTKSHSTLDLSKSLYSKMMNKMSLPSFLPCFRRSLPESLLMVCKSSCKE